jgi:hypothetical protein
MRDFVVTAAHQDAVAALGQDSMLAGGGEHRHTASSECTLCKDMFDGDVVMTAHELMKISDIHPTDLAGGGGWRDCSKCLAHTKTPAEAYRLHKLLAAHPHGHAAALQTHIHHIMLGNEKLSGGGCRACKSLNMSKRSALAFHSLFHTAPSKRR